MQCSPTRGGIAPTPPKTMPRFMNYENKPYFSPKLLWLDLKTRDAKFELGGAKDLYAPP